MKKQAHVHYSGRVQGIGLRYTVQDIARELGVTGWAKNLDDGRVEMVAEAEEEILKDFLSRVKQHFSRYIQDIEVDLRQASGEFRDFGIKF